MSFRVGNDGLWCARSLAPGFVGATLPVTLVRTTHAGFLESMRLFGVPPDHGCRLERAVAYTPERWHGLEQHPGLSRQGTFGRGFGVEMYYIILSDPNVPCVREPGR